PHARGSTPRFLESFSCDAVYPACAGIDPKKINSDLLFLSLPRMRGDRPSETLTATLDLPFTPHARGSTAFSMVFSSTFFVYPACAGIDPVCKALKAACSSLPRMRGDRPN